MTARDAVSVIRRDAGEKQPGEIGGGVHLLEVLPRLLDSPERELRVVEDGKELGVIDVNSMLEALTRQIASRDDCSIIELECYPADYSASHIAHAVEDSDVHLVDMMTNPSSDGRMRVTLRVRCEDPTPTVHSLERYGYEVTGSYGHSDVGRTAALERLMGLQALINV